MIIKGFNYGNIPAFYVDKESESFKRRFPKKFIVCSIEKENIYNVDNISEVLIPTSKISYVFIKEKFKTKRLLNNSKKHDKLNLTCFPIDLNSYFLNSNADVIIKLFPRTFINDPRLIENLVIRNKLEFLLKLDFKKSFQNILNSIYKNNITNTEEWVINFLETLPYNQNFEPIRYYGVIDDSLFKTSFKPSINDFVYGYCIRVNDIKKELELIKHLENDLCNFENEITIYNNYNDVLTRLKTKLNKEKIKYKDNKTFITLLAKDFYKINDMEFEITDFLR